MSCMYSENKGLLHLQSNKREFVTSDIWIYNKLVKWSSDVRVHTFEIYVYENNIEYIIFFFDRNIEYIILNIKLGN